MPSWYRSPPADARRNQPNGRSQRSSRGQGGDHDDFHASHPPKLTRFGPGLGAFMAGVTDGGGPRALRVTCARDGREHLVSDTEMDAGHAGPRVALCGHEVLPTVLVCPPGPPCSGCITVRWQHTDGRQAASRKGRHHRAGMLARLVSRLRDWTRPE